VSLSSVTNDTPDLPPDGKKDAGERAGKGTEVLQHKGRYVVVNKYVIDCDF
jgi:hypothetical protein